MKLKTLFRNGRYKGESGRQRRRPEALRISGRASGTEGKRDSSTALPSTLRASGRYEGEERSLDCARDDNVWKARGVEIKRAGPANSIGTRTARRMSFVPQDEQDDGVRKLAK